MSWNDMVIEQYRAGHERIADTFDQDKLLLLHTTGAKSGEPRLHPVAYLDKGDHLLIVASAAGADSHPAWYHNLHANPTVTVERWAGDRLESFDAVAAPAVGEQLELLWADLVAWAPGFAAYQKKTDRVIPVVVLRPRA